MDNQQNYKREQQLLKRFNKVLNEWLFSALKNYNPFTRYLREEAEEYPEVEEPKSDIYAGRGE